MLSRVANSLYWMSRYIERAENTVRLVDVTTQLLLDFRSVGNDLFEDFWMPILQATGDEESFALAQSRGECRDVREFLIFSEVNPNSLVNCVAQARENARMVRDQITIEFWEGINRMHLFLKSERAFELWETNTSDFHQEMKASSLYLQGLTDATISRTEGWLFLQVGKYIERADKTTRSLDIWHRTIPAKEVPKGLVDPTKALQWATVLRACSAWDVYHSIHGADVGPRRVAELLLLSEDFPRSVEFCCASIDSALRRISGVASGRFSNHAEKLSGRLLAEIQFSTIEDVFAAGFHEYLDTLQLRLNEISEAMFAAYIFQPFNEPGEMLQQQQQQQ